jgi:hypothetical protein
MARKTTGQRTSHRKVVKPLKAQRARKPKRSLLAKLKFW